MTSASDGAADPLAGGREATSERTFPIQQCGPIPRAAAERAYATYARMFGTKQSLDELGRRGGFTLSEWACLYLGHYPHDHYKFEGCIWKALSELRAPPALSSGPPAAELDRLADRVGGWGTLERLVQERAAIAVRDVIERMKRAAPTPEPETANSPLHPKGEDRTSGAAPTPEGSTDGADQGRTT